MSHVVQLSLKNKATLNLNVALVSTSKSYISVLDHISDEVAIVLFHLKQPNLVTQLDVTLLQNYQVLYFEKNNTLFDFKGLTYCNNVSQGNFILQMQYKIVLFIPKSISIPIAKLKGLHIFYSNKTLHWPKAICKSFTFKIPLTHVDSYNLSILEPLDIKQVSTQAFYEPSDSLPLLIKTLYQTVPDDAFLYDLAKRQTIRYAVLFKSYLSGYLHGISIYEMSPSNLIPNLIYQENEIHI
jgi:hypothetical protein